MAQKKSRKFLDFCILFYSLVLSTNHLQARNPWLQTMIHNVLQRKRLRHALGLQLNNHRSSMNLLIGNVQCIVRLLLYSYRLILIEQSIIQLLLQIHLLLQQVLERSALLLVQKSLLRLLVLQLQFQLLPLSQLELELLKLKLQLQQVLHHR